MIMIMIRIRIKMIWLIRNLIEASFDHLILPCHCLIIDRRAIKRRAIFGEGFPVILCITVELARESEQTGKCTEKLVGFAFLFVYNVFTRTCHSWMMDTNQHSVSYPLWMQGASRVSERLDMFMHEHGPYGAATADPYRQDVWQRGDARPAAGPGVWEHGGRQCSQAQILQILCILQET